MVGTRTALNEQEALTSIPELWLTIRALNNIATSHVNLRFECYQASVLTREDYSLIAGYR